MIEIGGIENLGAQIRRTRKSQKLTQAQLASVCGVTQKFISDLERGKTTGTFALVFNVLQGLGLRIYLEAPCDTLEDSP